MEDKNIVLRAIGFVKCPRVEATDDHWGSVVSVISLDPDQFDLEALECLDQFSHIEVIYHFHKVSPQKIVNKAEHPRENPNWPKVGIFAQRKKSRPNRLGLSICRLLAVDGLKLTVQALDAIDGTPVIDIKPCFREFLPEKAAIQQPLWVSEVMNDYFTDTKL